MDGISYELYRKYVRDFLNVSEKISDTWQLVDVSNVPDSQYLNKVVTAPVDIDGEQLVLRWEYQVYYSSSYNVPVLCFNVWKSNGSLLKLEDVWKCCKLRCDSKEEFYSALTQQEHPILLRPYFTIHPCKTAEILNIGDHDFNPIVKYISAIGPMVNLFLSNDYGMIQAQN